MILTLFYYYRIKFQKTVFTLVLLLQKNQKTLKQVLEKMKRQNTKQENYYIFQMKMMINIKLLSPPKILSQLQMLLDQKTLLIIRFVHVHILLLIFYLLQTIFLVKPLQNGFLDQMFPVFLLFKKIYIKDIEILHCLKMIWHISMNI